MTGKVGAQQWTADSRISADQQASALIQELRRLQYEFDHRQMEPDVPVDDRPADAPARRRRRRRRKGVMGRAINACLAHLGLGATESAPATARRPDVATAPALPAPAASHATLPARMVAGVRNGVGFLIKRNARNDETSTDPLAKRVGRAFEGELRTGLRFLLAALAIGGGWAVLVPLAGAVTVPGNLVVKSTVKKIQHLSGGIVAEIGVSDGMRVQAGDLLIRLDATQARANLQVVSKQLDEIRCRMARLTAERDDAPELVMPADIKARVGQPDIKALMDSEETLFRARAVARKSQKELLSSRIAQLGEEITGLDAQIKSKAMQIDLISGELSGVEQLYDKKLVPLTRVTSLQREKARIDGERGQLVSSIAETKSKISEAQLQIVRVDQDFRSDVLKELNESQSKDAELTERGIAARDLLDRIDIRAPTSGVIHQLAVHTIGGVIRAGDVIMEIVPDTDELEIEARLQPNDIDQVRPGQTSFVRFSAFNQRVTPQVSGLVSYVSADISRDQQTNAPYFTIKVSLPDEERRRLAGLQLVSGMPAEVFMQTGSRTMMSYLLKPVTDQLKRAFIER